MATKDNASQKVILITGAAGFIGSHLAQKLLEKETGARIVGMDNMNDYYDVTLKEKRLTPLLSNPRFHFEKANIVDKQAVDKIFRNYSPNTVVNLAAQAGVRFSIESPQTYIDSNIVGFFNLLEACRHSYDQGRKGVEHLVYASSSSVYGASEHTPYSTDDAADSPVSLYAATKKTDELMAHAYAKLYNIPCTGLRFFTVYGPAGRPDMAYYSFAERWTRGETVKLYNYGRCKRDFTYIGDIVEGIMKALGHAPGKQTGKDGLPLPPYKIYNIGNGHPENLLTFVETLREELIKAGVLPADFDLQSHCELAPMQPGDVVETYADTRPLEQDFGYRPSTTLREGLRKFAQWYAANQVQ